MGETLLIRQVLGEYGRLVRTPYTLLRQGDVSVDEAEAQAIAN